MKTGDVITKHATYRTRDTVNLVKLAKLAQAMKDWQEKNKHNQKPSTQRKVKAIQTSMWLGLENQSEGK